LCLEKHKAYTQNAVLRTYRAYRKCCPRTSRYYDRSRNTEESCKEVIKFRSEIRRDYHYVIGNLLRLRGVKTSYYISTTMICTAKYKTSKQKNHPPFHIACRQVGHGPRSFIIHKSHTSPYHKPLLGDLSSCDVTGNGSGVSPFPGTVGPPTYDALLLQLTAYLNILK
jgi:hypothetical protein